MCLWVRCLSSQAVAQRPVCFLLTGPLYRAAPSTAAGFPQSKEVRAHERAHFVTWFQKWLLTAFVLFFLLERRHQGHPTPTMRGYTRALGAGGILEATYHRHQSIQPDGSHAFEIFVIRGLSSFCFWLLKIACLLLKISVAVYTIELNLWPKPALLGKLFVVTL